MARAGAPLLLSPRSSRVAALAAAALLLVAGAVLVVGPASGGRGSALVQGAAVDSGGGAASAAPPLQAAQEDTAAAGGGAAATPAAKAAPPRHADPAVWVAFPVKELPHDPAAFTQGLLFERWCGGEEVEKEGGGDGGADAAKKANKHPPPPVPSSCREVFWESTGMNGESSVRAVEVGTGAVLAAARLPDADFGEGLALVPPGGGGGGGGSPPRLLQLTWQSGKAYWHDAAALRRAAAAANASGGGGGGLAAGAGAGAGAAAAIVPAGTETRTPLGDGWGAATAPPASPSTPPPLILSDGSPTLTWVDSTDLRALRSVTVKDGAKAVASLNELEWVSGPVRFVAGPPPRAPPADGSPPPTAPAADAKAAAAAAAAAHPPPPPPPPPPAGGVLPGGEVWANVWGTDCVARIDPGSGRVVGWVVAPSLRRRAAVLAASRPPPHGAAVDVLNGIAADPASGRVWLGGKYWPALFEVGFADAAAPGGPFGGDAAAALAATRQVCGRSLSI